MTMQALWIENKKLTFKESVAKPQLSAQDALIKVLCAGICGTDLGFLQGYYSFSGIAGHEFVGSVVDVGVGVSQIQREQWLGKRVVGSINIDCGYCQQCLAGRKSHCLNRQVLGIRDRPGAFAQYLSLPIANLYEVPDQIPNNIAVFTEPLAAALQILEQVTVKPDSTVVVIGAGRLGQLIAQMLAKTSCQLLVVSRNPQTLEPLDHLGIETALLDKLPKTKFDIAIECSGNLAGFDLARSLLRAQGTLVLKSTYADNLVVNMSSLVVDEISLVGSRCGPFAKAIEYLAHNFVDLSYMVQKKYSLADGIEAFQAASERGSLKVIFTQF